MRKLLKNTVLFDLDGTITDPAEGVLHSLQHMMKKFGVQVSEADLLDFIGPPLANTLMEKYGFSKEKAELGVAFYREYYTPQGWQENTVYEGIPQLLKALKQAGAKVALATSKPTFFANKILKKFDLLQYFDAVCGIEMDGFHVAKRKNVAMALHELGESPQNCIMVGDRKYDVIGATENGMDCIGVLYGYGAKEELEGAGAKYIAETVEALAKWLLGEQV